MPNPEFFVDDAGHIYPVGPDAVIKHRAFSTSIVRPLSEIELARTITWERLGPRRHRVCFHYGGTWRVSECQIIPRRWR